jgi:hypothetical protein
MFRRVFAPSFWRWFLYGPLKARCATLLLTAGCPLGLLSLLDFRGQLGIKIGRKLRTSGKKLSAGHLCPLLTASLCQSENRKVARGW